ncbi:uncharacterized protein LOC114542944 [Dendronephthya gigantea]|uniref:uncharacterized protein LOC114533185 n=1 Tax=Dendronephthya gigantea TaxID=151771 RepID=UPI00106BA61F|nr:uncharacterized protein LOC114533185 [Dendronephthya gigantea]XP_028418080.1 uncharacterized protein LOC114542944 [Dendronephthya gigantea]
MLEDQIADIWPEYPCLYDVRCPDFKNRELLEHSFKEIAEKLGQTVEWVKAKLKALRNSYVKAKKPGPSGSARRNPTKRTTWLLDKLQFLAPHVAIRPSVSSLDSVSHDNSPLDSSFSEAGENSFEDYGQTPEQTSPINEEEDEIMEVTRSTSEPVKPRKSTSRKRQADEEYQLIKNLSTSIAEKQKKQKMTEGKRETSMLETFGMYVTKALSELDPRTCHLAQNKINNIIFEAQAGLLVQNSQPPMMMQQHRNFFHPIIQTGMTSSSPQPSSSYAEQNFISKPDGVTSAVGWPNQN